MKEGRAAGGEGHGDAGMAELLKLLLEDRRRRDYMLVEERVWWERERCEQEKKMTEQLNILQAVVEQTTTKPTRSQHHQKTRLS